LLAGQVFENISTLWFQGADGEIAGKFAPAANNFLDLGGNLIGVSGPGSGNTGFTNATTKTGTVNNPLDPMLGPLQNNGGPVAGSTGNLMTLQTEQPMAGSPLIGAGTLALAPPTDERGAASIVNGQVNIGAVSQVVLPPGVTGTQTATSGDPAAGNPAPTSPMVVPVPVSTAVVPVVLAEADVQPSSGHKKSHRHDNHHPFHTFLNGLHKRLKGHHTSPA
jgi:hypothetical protein